MTTTALRRRPAGRPAGDLSSLLGPVLASDLPPAGPVRPGVWARTRSAVAALHHERRDNRAFERALAGAQGREVGDLIAAQRRG